MQQMKGKDPNASRSPHGERGLKFHAVQNNGFDVQSLPTRGAWIEISSLMENLLNLLVAPHTGSVD